MLQGWTLQEWTNQHDVAGVDIAGVDNAGVLKQVRQVEMCAHTAALNDHLLGASDDDDDDGADEDAAQTTDQTPPQDAAVTSEPTTRASDDCCEVCLINRKDPCIHVALVPCVHQRFCESCTETVHQRGDRCPLCRADITMILHLY